MNRFLITLLTVSGGLLAGVWTTSQHTGHDLAYVLSLVAPEQWVAAGVISFLAATSVALAFRPPEVKHMSRTWDWDTMQRYIQKSASVLDVDPEDPEELTSRLNSLTRFPREVIAVAVAHGFDPEDDVSDPLKESLDHLEYTIASLKEELSKEIANRNLITIPHGWDGSSVAINVQDGEAFLRWKASRSSKNSLLGKIMNLAESQIDPEPPPSDPAPGVSISVSLPPPPSNLPPAPEPSSSVPKADSTPPPTPTFLVLGPKDLVPLAMEQGRGKLPSLSDFQWPSSVLSTIDVIYYIDTEGEVIVVRDRFHDWNKSPNLVRDVHGVHLPWTSESIAPGLCSPSFLEVMRTRYASPGRGRVGSKVIVRNRVNADGTERVFLTTFLGVESGRGRVLVSEPWHIQSQDCVVLPWED